MNDPAGSRTEARGVPTAAEGGWYRRWFPLLRLVWVGTAGAVWCAMPQWGPLIVALAAAAWAVHAALTREMWHRTPFDGALLFFVATAGVSLAAAYDPQGARPVFPLPIGWGKLWGLTLAALLFYALTSLKRESERRWVMGLVSGFGAMVAVWFLATNDWGARPVKWSLIPALGQLVQSVMPALPGPVVNPNTAGGLVALSLPMSLELLGTAQPDEKREGEKKRRRESRLWRIPGVLSAALMGMALLLSSSRGAWLGLAGAFCVAGAWWLAGTAQAEKGGQGEGSRRRRRILAFVGLGVAGALVSGLALAAVPWLRALTLGSAAVSNRRQIFWPTVLLVRDYPFTGCGLGQFPLVHSTYALLIHVPVLIYAHATPLAVAVEQGLPAAFMLLGVWVAAAWTGLRALGDAEQAPAGLSAGLLALTVLVIHSLFDNVIYGTQALPLLWLPVGLIVAAERQTRRGENGEWRAEDGPFRAAQGKRWERGHWRAIAATVLVALIVGGVFWRQLAAAWHANLGAVHQTLVELPAYDWHQFDNPTLDEVRQREDLSAAVTHFERALALDPGQATARTRLAHIALARRDYEEGLTHARAAWEAGHRDRVTRLVLGEALVAQGRVTEAASVVRGPGWAEARFDGQAFYRYWVNEDWQRAAYAWRAVLLLDPDNARVQQAVERAEERLAEEQ